MTEAAAEMWGSADYELLAERLAPIHDELVARLGPRRGIRWADLATGTGEVALRAARAGAEVTGLDLTPKLLGQARAKAEAEGLDVAWDLGDARRLPYDDGSFDVVSSSFGVVFAPEPQLVARELARVCRPGGRLGITSWKPHPAALIYERFQDEPPAFDAETWSTPELVRELLDGDFELDVSEGVWALEAPSPEELWEFMCRAGPPFRAFADRLDPERRAAFRRAFLEHWEGYRGPGGVSEPRHYLLVLGTRR